MTDSMDGNGNEKESSSGISDQLRTIRTQKSNRSLLFAIMVMVFVMGLAILYYASQIRLSDGYRGGGWSETDQDVTRLIGFLLIVLAVGFLSYLYMMGSLRPASQLSVVGGENLGQLDFQQLVILVESIEKSALVLSENKTLSAADLKRIEAKFLKGISEYLPEKFLGQFKQQYGKKVLNENVIELAQQQSKKSISRLQKLSESFATKSSTSLAWGLSISAGGMGILAFFLYSIETDFFKDRDTMEIVFYYVSRLSFVAMIEAVGMFFFRQYRVSMADDLYVNNEITNLEMRLTSLHAAVSLDDPETISVVLSELARTERNFILKKDERSALYLGHDQADSQSGKLDLILKAVESVKSGKT